MAQRAPGKAVTLSYTKIAVAAPHILLCGGADDQPTVVRTKLLVLCGYMCTIDEELLSFCRNLAEHLAGTVSGVYVADMRHHGQSHANVYDGRPSDMVDFLDDVRHFIGSKSRADSRWIIWGHSFGGKLAQVLALAFPSMIAGFISEDMSAIHDMSGLTGKISRIIEDLQAVDLNELVTVEAVSDSLKFRIPEVARRDVYLKDLRRHPTTGKLYWRSNLEELKRSLPLLLKDAIGAIHRIRQLSGLTTDIDTPEEEKTDVDHSNSGSSELEAELRVAESIIPSKLTPYRGPTHVICGNDSFALKDGKRRVAMKKWFPCAQFYDVEDAAHFVRRQQPKRVMEILIRIIRELTGASNT